MSVTYKIRCSRDGEKVTVSVADATAAQVAEIVQELEAEGLSVVTEVLANRDPNPPIEFRR